MNESMFFYNYLDPQVLWRLIYSERERDFLVKSKAAVRLEDLKTRMLTCDSLALLFPEITQQLNVFPNPVLCNQVCASFSWKVSFLWSFDILKRCFM